MKIAHLILAHKNPVQLERLIKALQHPAFTFYIHVDKKTDQKSFEYLRKRNDTFFVVNRAKIYWAGYGTIQATINGFEEIIGKGYDYINVISAQDFPIKSPVYIYQYLLQRGNTEFMTCYSIDEEWKDAATRVRDYHFINWRIPGKFKLQFLANKILPARKFPFDFKIVGRANWFTVTNAAAVYMLSFFKQNPSYTQYFKYCWGADEFIFATILYNSHFKERMAENLVYVDWEGQENGHPRVLDINDFDKLKASEKLFARKMDIDHNSALFDALEHLIKED